MATMAKCIPRNTGISGSVRSSNNSGRTLCVKYRYQFVTKFGRVKPNSDIARTVRAVCRLKKTIECKKNARKAGKTTCLVKKEAFLEAVQINKRGRYNTKTRHWDVTLGTTGGSLSRGWKTFATSAP